MFTMLHPGRFILLLLAACLVAGTAGATLINTQGGLEPDDAVSEALTQAAKPLSADIGEAFTIYGRITYASTGLPAAGDRMTLQERSSGGAWTAIDSMVTDSDGRYSFTQTRYVAGVYEFRTLMNGVSDDDVWRVTVGSGVPVTTTTAPITTVPIVTFPNTIPTVPGGATYAQARDYYVQAAGAWSQAWGASDFVLIRQYLNQAKTLYTSSLYTANTVNDPANAANLALVKTVSTAYISLADAALAMYDAADAYGAGQAQINAGSYAAAAASFQTAAETDERSKTLFNEATTTLQSVSYAGTEYGDGTAYTAAIVPILNGKAAYVGDYATYARAWQHTSLALQARVVGDDATFRSEATQAMNLFGSLRASPSFGTDAATNYNILVAMIGSATQGQTPVVTTVVTTEPTPRPTIVLPTTIATTKSTPRPTIVVPTTATTTSWSFEGPWKDTSGIYFWFLAPEGSRVRGGWEFGEIGGEDEGSFTGTLSNGGNVLSGSFETMFQGGTFRFTLTDANHFMGYMDSPSGKVSISCTRM
jgi:hypothetical protein